MTASDVSELPNVAEVLAGVLESVPRQQQPLLVAIAERMAAERYRGWAAEPDYGARRGELLDCAQREEDIAGRIEALYPDAEAIQRELRDKNPDLDEINRRLFAGRPVSEQLTIQAQGERLGAATWRAFAKKADGQAAEVFKACAVLEEESAIVLESILQLQR